MYGQCRTSSIVSLYQLCLAPDLVAIDYMTVPAPATEAEAAGSAADKGPLLLVCSTSKVSNSATWYDRT